MANSEDKTRLFFLISRINTLYKRVQIWSTVDLWESWVNQSQSLDLLPLAADKHITNMASMTLQNLFITGRCPGQKHNNGTLLLVISHLHDAPEISQVWLDDCNLLCCWAYLTTYLLNSFDLCVTQISISLHHTMLTLYIGKKTFQIKTLQDNREWIEWIHCCIII